MFLVYAEPAGVLLSARQGCGSVSSCATVVCLPNYTSLSGLLASHLLNDAEYEIRLVCLFAGVRRKPFIIVGIAVKLAREQHTSTRFMSRPMR